MKLDPDALTHATIPELHAALTAVATELWRREHVCAECGGDIPQSLGTCDPAHAKSCTRWGHVAAGLRDWFDTMVAGFPRRPR